MTSRPALGNPNFLWMRNKYIIKFAWPNYHFYTAIASIAATSLALHFQRRRKGDWGWGAQCVKSVYRHRLWRDNLSMV